MNDKWGAILCWKCNNTFMHRRSSKRDVAQNALRVVEQAIGAPLQAERKVVSFPSRKKNPAAVALGKLGGMKGGRARAAKLTPEERKEIAQRAAKARWGKG
jgi:hypothetical protein